MRAINTRLAGLAILGTCVIGVLGQPPAVPPPPAPPPAVPPQAVPTQVGQPPAAQEKPAAVVNGEAIQMAEVRAVLDTRPSPVVLTAAQQRELRHAALDMLVDDMLMRQFLRKNALPAQPQEVQKELDELKDALK